MTSSGVRLLARSIWCVSYSGSRLLRNLTGMICSPSPNTSRASVLREPGDCPPMSLLCPMLAQNATTRPSWKTGSTTTMSLGCGQPE